MIKIMTIIAMTFVSVSAIYAQSDSKITKTGHIKFFSHSSVEDISADNYAVTSSISPATGEVVFSVPMQSFKFEKALMQKHFNSPDFLDTKQFPKAKFKGNITDLKSVNFAKDGKYNATFTGELTIHGVTQKVAEKGTITVKGGTFVLDLKMKVALADYKIALKDGKPSTNVAKEIEVTVKTEYK